MKTEGEAGDHGMIEKDIVNQSKPAGFFTLSKTWSTKRSKLVKYMAPLWSVYSVEFRTFSGKA